MRGAVLLAAALALAIAPAPPARADGDLASDVLLSQDSFLPYAPPLRPRLKTALEKVAGAGTRGRLPGVGRADPGAAGSRGLRQHVQPAAGVRRPAHARAGPADSACDPVRAVHPLVVMGSLSFVAEALVSVSRSSAGSTALRPGADLDEPARLSGMRTGGVFRLAAWRGCGRCGVATWPPRSRRRRGCGRPAAGGLHGAGAGTAGPPGRRYGDAPDVGPERLIVEGMHECAVMFVHGLSEVHHIPLSVSSYRIVIQYDGEQSRLQSHSPRGRC